jgi:hypothetical protein
LLWLFRKLVGRRGVSWTVCLDWPRTSVLPISASQLPRIIGMTHWYPPTQIFSFQLIIYLPKQWSFAKSHYSKKIFLLSLEA